VKVLRLPIVLDDMAIENAANQQNSSSRLWAASFRLLFRLTPNRLVLRLTKHLKVLPIAEVVIVGRRTGLARRYPLTVLDVGGRSYIGHPNGRSQWVRNLVAAGSATVVRGAQPLTLRAIELDDCPERDAVVQATSQQPFPANLVYRGGRGHVAAVGTYFRLEPMTPEEAPP
jgi:deazaflavin-dependent oxidoreductase (nitroreductase family)